MCRIMSRDHYLDRKDILKFIFYFIILLECNNVIILCLIVFCLNWNQYVNSHRYKVFLNPIASRSVIN
jgi:hypothetical protein